jgi:hypothetical protein
MLGLEHLGLQSEHYNHTNCTFLPDGRWRGQQHAAGIGWVWGSQMLGGSRLSQLDPLAFSLRPQPPPTSRPQADIAPHVVAGEEHLWW